MTGMQVVNAVQAGNADLAARLSQCCCENRLLTTTQGYETRIALSEQTNFLGAKLDNQTNIIVDKFCDLEKRELQGKIDSLLERNSQLQSTLDNANQTSQIMSYINTVVSPIAADVASIKCSTPPTVPVQFPTLQAVQTTPYCANFAGFSPFGFGNGCWG
jgi:hypothetical protein